MNTALQNLIDNASISLSQASLKVILNRFTSECGFSFFAFANLRGVESSALSSYPQEWQKIYFENDFFKIDPVITQAKRGSYIYKWPRPHIYKDISEPVANFYGTASEFGIRSGLSIAIPTGFGHFAILTLATDDKDIIGAEKLNSHLAVIAVTMLHRSFNDTIPSSKKHIDLTPRETTCLRWAAEGKSNQDIAKILGITHRAVRFHIDEAKRKLLANNVTQAAAIASRLFLI